MQVAISILVTRNDLGEEVLAHAVHRCVLAQVIAKVISYGQCPDVEQNGLRNHSGTVVMMEAT